MNVFDFAMQMEQDGKAYYQKLAGQTTHPGLQKIFKRLVDDEQKHYETFRELKAGNTVPEMADTTVLEEARNVFETLPKADRVLGEISNDLEAYRHSMQLEAKSYRLYEEAAGKEQDENCRALLLKIAGEERKHFNILDNLYHFINAPNEYLAWGEFSNIGEFHQFGRDVDK